MVALCAILARLTRRELLGCEGSAAAQPALSVSVACAAHARRPATVAASTAAARSPRTAASSSAPAAVGLARRWGSLFECAARGAPPLALWRPGNGRDGCLGARSNAWLASLQALAQRRAIWQAPPRLRIAAGQDSHSRIWQCACCALLPLLKQLPSSLPSY